PRDLGARARRGLPGARAGDRLLARDGPGETGRGAHQLPRHQPRRERAGLAGRDAPGARRAAHVRELSVAVAASASPGSGAAGPSAGGAVRMTRHGALSTTWRV